MSVNSRVIVPLGSSPAGITPEVSSLCYAASTGFGTADDTQHARSFM